MTKIQLKRSSALLSGSAQAPTTSQLDYGELAINYNSSDPQLFFKDSTGSVVSLFDNYAALGGATFTGDVAFSADVDFDGAVTIKGDSTNGSGKLSLTCEQNTHTVNIKAPAHSSAANYTLTLPSSAGTSSQVLTTDGSGNLSWAVSSMSTADKNKLDGIESGATVSLWTVSGSDTYFTGGSAGVGTNSPSYPIDIVSDVNAVAANIRGRSSDNIGTLTFRSNDNTATYGLVQARTNEFRITTDSSSQPIVFRTDSEKLRITGSGDVKIPNDNGKFMAGAGDDLQMYHDGTTSFIEATGELIMKGSNLRFRSSADEKIINAHQNGSVDLFYDNSKKLATTSTGVTVTGNLTCDTATIGGIQASGFLRSDADDSFTGTITGNSDGTNPVLNIDGAGPNIIRFSDDGSTTKGIDLVFRTNQNTLGFEKSTDATQLWETDCDDGVTNFHYTPTVSGSTIWHAGNDGSGSGLDADNLDGYTWDSSGKNVRASEFYADSWFRNYNAGKGLYNEATQQHFYSASSTYWHLNSSNGLIFYDAYNASAGNATNRKGYVYWSGDGFGLLSSGGSWCVNIPPGGGASNALVVGGGSTNNHYNSVSTARMSFGGGNDFSNYHVGVQQENYGGTYTKLDLRWHTGMRMGAQSAYGGIRLYDNEDLSNLQWQFNGSSAYTYKYVWLKTNTTGMHSDTNSAHIYPNTASTYAQWQITGSRNNYAGLMINYTYYNALMYDSAGNGGLYQQNGFGWHFYFHRTNTCLGVAGSTTSSSYGLYVTGGIYATGNVVAYSDARKKTNIETIKSALNKVLNLRGVTYNKIELDKTVNDKSEIGVIAQEVEKVVPEVVTYAEDVDEYGVSYGNLTALLIEAIKELKIELNELKESLA